MGKTLKGIVVFLIVLILAVCAGGVIAFAYAAFLPVVPDPVDPGLSPGGDFSISTPIVPDNLFDSVVVSLCTTVEDPLLPLTETDLFNPPVFEPGNPIFVSSEISNCLDVADIHVYDYETNCYGDSVVVWQDENYLDVDICPKYPFWHNPYVSMVDNPRFVPYISPLYFCFTDLQFAIDSGVPPVFELAPESWCNDVSVFFSLQRLDYYHVRISGSVKTANEIFEMYDYDGTEDLALFISVRYVDLQTLANDNLLRVASITYPVVFPYVEESV